MIEFNGVKFSYNSIYRAFDYKDQEFYVLVFSTIGGSDIIATYDSETSMRSDLDLFNSRKSFVCSAQTIKFQ